MRETVLVLLATGALLSTKHILVDRGWHYPLHLLAAQLVPIVFVTVFGNGRLFLLLNNSRFQMIFPELDAGRIGVLQPCEQFKTFAGASTLAVSLLLFTQAILHFPNLPTLAILISLTILLETLCTRWPAQSARTTTFSLTIITLVSSAALIMFDEYRLDVNGLLFGLPAIGLFGLSKFILCTHNQPLVAETSSDDVLLTPWTDILRTTTSMALLVTVCGAALFEDTSSALRILLYTDPLVWIINIVLMFFATICGSVVISISQQHSLNQGFSFGPLISNICLFPGLTALGTRVFGRPAYSTSLQLFAAIGAVIIYTIGSWAVVSEFSHDINHDGGTCEHCRDILLQSHELEDGIPSANDCLLSQCPNHRRTDGQWNHELEDQSLSKLLYAAPEYMVQWYRSDSKSSRLPTLSVIAGIVAWSAFVYLNFYAPTPSSHQVRIPNLDLTHRSQVDLDIVVSMFDEEPSTVKSMVSRLQALPNISGRSTRVIIYIKNNNVNTDLLKIETGATEIIKRPNIGREGEAYLHHITSKWDDLATQTLFVQAHVHNSWDFIRRVRHYLTSTTGMLSLGFVGKTCNPHDCWDRWGWDDDSGFISQVYQRVHNQTASTVLLSYKGQFIASARRIRGIGRDVYESLHTTLVDPSSWAHSQGYLQGRRDSLNAPVFGYTLERLWSVLMQCSDLEIADKCPTLLSGTRRGGSLADCQCFDEVR